MKNFLQTFFTSGLILFGVILFTGCDSDEDDPGPQLTGNSKEYMLRSVSNPAISGTVTFAERDDDMVVITIELNGTAAGNSHPAHIHANSAAEGGSIVLDLENVDGGSGMSETVVDALNDGTAITYNDLLNFDGYVNVHLSSNELATLIAQGDIGSNELTGEKKEYTMIPVADPSVSGKVILEKRKNGTTLVTIDLEGTQADASHPAHFHSNTIAETGPIVIGLTNVDGTTGMSRTSVEALNSGTAITYDELLNFNGYVNVHTGATFVAQVDIGQNELTGDKKEYTLNEVNDSGVSGKAIFEKRKNGKAQVTLDLDGTVDGGDHPAHIHSNDVATGGGIVVDLKNVNGATGKSVTSVSKKRDDTEISYDELMTFNGHINVHMSPDDLPTLIVRGNIGSNAP